MHHCRQLYRGASLLCAAVMAVSTAGCLPRYAGKKEIIQFAEDYVQGESIVCDGVSDTDKHCYLFHSEERDLSFQVWTAAHTISIDGADFGYTGDYGIYTDYPDALRRYYSDRIYDKMAACGYTDYTTSSTFQAPYHFTFSIENYVSADLDTLNDFFAELNTITREERACHGGELPRGNALYNIEVVYHSGSAYYRTAGLNRSDYTTDILGDDTDYDVRHFHLYDMTYAMGNVIPDTQDGILIYVPHKEEES